MKVANTAVIALLASSAMGAATPVAQSQELTLIKKDTVSDLLVFLKDLEEMGQKRDLASGKEREELARRADNALTDFLSAFISSGILGDIFSTLTSDSGLRTELWNIAKSVFSAIASDIIPLLTSIYNSGLLGQIWSDFINNSALTSATLALGESIVTWLIGLFTGGSTTTTTAATATATATATARLAAKRDLEELILNSRSFDEIMSDDSIDYLTKRDLSDIITSLFSAILSSGIISSAISYVENNPSKVLTILETAFNFGVTIFNWLKSSGIIGSIFDFLESHTSGIIHTIITLVGSILGVNSTATSSATTTALTTSALATTATSITVNAVTTTTTSTGAILSAASAAEEFAATAFGTTLVKKRRAY